MKSNGEKFHLLKCSLKEKKIFARQIIQGYTFCKPLHDTRDKKLKVASRSCKHRNTVHRIIEDNNMKHVVV